MVVISGARYCYMTSGREKSSKRKSVIMEYRNGWAPSGVFGWWLGYLPRVTTPRYLGSTLSSMFKIGIRFRRGMQGGDPSAAET